MTLQAALPRELYVDAAPGRASASGCCCASGSASAGVDDLGLRRAGRGSPWSRSLGESRAGDLGRATARCTRRTTCAGTAGSQVVPDRAGHRPPQLCGAKSLRCPYHSWTYGLDGSLLRAPHTEEGDFDPAEFGLHAGRRRGVGRLRLRAPDARRRAGPLRRASARRRSALARYTLAALVDRADAAPTRSRPTGRSSRRTTTSATTAARCTRSCPGWCRRSPAAARVSTGTAASRTARAPGRSP